MTATADQAILPDAASLEGAIRAIAGETPQIEFEVEPEIATLWITMRPEPRPCFTVEMLQSVLRLQEAVRQLHGRRAPAHGQPLKFLVLRSGTKGVFNLGGDLDLFLGAIGRGDLDAMNDYGRLATRGCHSMLDGMGGFLVSIALVQGLALGGGFEVARCCDLVVAERQSAFQLPETRFSLFPANGAVSVLSRRMDRRLLARMFLDGDEVRAVEGVEIGLVDALADEGDGEARTREVIRSLLPKHGAAAAFYKGLAQADGITLGGMLSETERWAEASLGLSEGDQNTIRRIVNAQNRRFARKA